MGFRCRMGLQFVELAFGEGACPLMTKSYPLLVLTSETYIDIASLDT